jgi:signal transduction histidine kinase
MLFDGENGVIVDGSVQRRLEAVGRLSGGIAHELTTPIQFVSDNLGFLRDAVDDLLPLIEKYRAMREKLKAGGKPSAAELATLEEAEADADLDFLAEELPRATEESKKGLERVSSMVKALRDFVPAEEIIAVDVNRAVQTALTFARHEYKYVADVFTNLGAVPLVQCHAGELNQALLDLLLDAARAAKDVKPRGRIEVSTRVEASHVVVQIGAGEVKRLLQSQAGRTTA